MTVEDLNQIKYRSPAIRGAMLATLPSLLFWTMIGFAINKWIWGGK